MKRSISLFLCIILFMTVLPASALAHSGNALPDGGDLSAALLHGKHIQQKSPGRLQEGTEPGAANPDATPEMEQDGEEATPKPEAGETPNPTATPEPTEAPVPTATPEPTESPEPTATSEPAATPEPTATPEPVPEIRFRVAGYETLDADGTAHYLVRCAVGEETELRPVLASSVGKLTYRWQVWNAETEEYVDLGLATYPGAESALLPLAVAEEMLDIEDLYRCVVTAELGNASATGFACFTLELRAETEAEAPVPVASITITAPEEQDYVLLGETLQLTADVLPENAADKSVTWASSDETIATVDQTGLVTAHAEGTVTITAAACKGNGVNAVYELVIIAARGKLATKARSSGVVSCAEHSLEQYEADYTMCGGGFTVPYARCSVCKWVFNPDGSDFDWETGFVEGNGEHSLVQREANYTVCGGGFTVPYAWCSVCGAIFNPDGSDFDVDTGYAEGNGAHSLVQHEADYTVCSGGFTVPYAWCSVCGAIFNPDGSNFDWETGFVEGNGAHSLVQHEAEDTVCGGGIAFPHAWCSACGGIFNPDGSYLDANAGCAKGNGAHSLEQHEANYAVCSSGFTVPWAMCSVCGGIFNPDGSAFDFETGYAEGNGNHSLVQCAADYTVCDGGITVPYARCSVCGEIFSPDGSDFDWETGYAEGNGNHSLVQCEADYTECGGGFTVPWACCSVCERPFNPDGSDFDWETGYAEGNGEHSLVQYAANYTPCGGGFTVPFAMCSVCGRYFNPDGSAFDFETNYAEGNGNHSLVQCAADYTVCGGGITVPYARCSVCWQEFNPDGSDIDWERNYVSGRGRHSLIQREAVFDEYYGGFTAPYAECAVCGGIFKPDGSEYDWYLGYQNGSGGGRSFAIRIESTSDLEKVTSGQNVELTGRFYPYNKTYTSIVWSVAEEDQAYAKISSRSVWLGTSSATLTAKEVDTARTVTVIARSADALAAEATCEVTILPRTTGVVIKEGEREIAATGTAVQTHVFDMKEAAGIVLSAVTSPADASGKVTWKTSSTAIATVDEATGQVTFVRPGTVTITATAADGSGKSASVKLQVIYLDAAAKLTAASNMPAIGLQAGDMAQISVFGTDKENALSASEFEYSIPATQQAIATVDETGVVTAGTTKTGTVTVTAALKNDPLKRKATVNIKVIPRQTARVLLSTDEGKAPAPAEIVWLDANGLATENSDEIRSYVVNLDAAALEAYGLQKSGYTFTIMLTLEDAEANPIPLTNKSVKYATTDSRIATVKLNADGSALVTVKGNAAGACTITATTTDLAKATGHLSVYVRDYAPRLGSNKLMVNPKTAGGAVSALTGSYGNAVTDVTLHEYNSMSRIYEADASTKFSVTYDQEKQHLTVKAAGALENQTVKAQLRVTCADMKIYPIDVTITVKNSEPAITVKQIGRFNLFYLDSETVLAVTAKDAKVTGVALTGTPDFVGEDNGDGTLTVRYAEGYAGGSVNTKARLLVTIEGYPNAVEKAVTIGTVKSKPKLTLSPGSSVINTALSDRSTVFSVYNATAKETVSLDSVTGTVAFANYSVNSEKDAITLTLTGTTGGSAVLTVQEANWAEGIAVTHKVTVQTTVPTAKLSAGTLKLNSRFSEQAATTRLTLNQSNQRLDETATAATITNVTTGALAEQGNRITVSYVGGEITARFADPNLPAAKGTYSYQITPVLASGEALKPVTVKVSVTEAEPTVSFVTGTLKLNRLLAGEEEVWTELKLSTKEGYLVAGFAELSEGPQTRDGLQLRYENGRLYAKLIDAAAALSKGSYELTPIVKDEATGQLVSLGKKIRLTVQSYSNASISATAAAKGSLDATQRSSAASAIVYTITKLTNVAGEIESIWLTGPDAAKFELQAMVLNAKGQATAELRLKETESYATKASYKIQLAVKVKGVTEPVLTKEQTVKVKQSALKLKTTAIQGNAYQSQNGTATAEYLLTVTGPMSGKIERIELDSVKTLLALRQALGVSGTITPEIAGDGRSATVKVRLKDTSKVAAGKSYTFLVNVYPEGNAADVNPVQVKLTMKVGK